MSVTRALGFLGELELTEVEQLIGARIVKEIRERLTFLDDVGVGYLNLDRGVGDALRRRGAAAAARDADRLAARRRPLHPRRAVDRPPPARQRQADRHARAAARPRQHGRRRRARRADDALGRLARRHGAGRGRARRPRRRRGDGGEGAARRAARSRGSSSRGRGRSRCPSGAPRISARSRVRGASQHNLKGIDVEFPVGEVRLRDGRVRLGQVDARQRDRLQGAARTGCTGCARSRASTSRSRGSTCSTR